MYNFYGDYDLTDYFEQKDNENEARKNLCLCFSTKKGQPVSEIALVIGKAI